MSSFPYPLDPARLKEELARRLAEAGAFRSGIAEAAPVAAEWVEAYSRWVDEGKCAEMRYMERYGDIRRDPSLLLEGARSIISAAFHYPPTLSTGLRIASYALVDDYHTELRGRLEDVASWLRDATGCGTRVCVDTAPLRERYWAQRAGLGFIGRNNCLIVPGAGSFFFLAEIITTLPLPADQSIENQGCGSCKKCVEVCPAGALDGCGAVDARRCLSYLTIEHKGEFPGGTDLHGHFYGCDDCQRACPHNRAVIEGRLQLPTVFQTRGEIAGMTDAGIRALTPDSYAATFRNSPIKRAKLPTLLRNLDALNL